MDNFGQKDTDSIPSETEADSDSFGLSFNDYKDTFGENDGTDWFGSKITVTCECGAEKTGSPGHSHWCGKAGK